LREEAQALWDRGMCRHLTPSDVLVIGDDGPIDNAFRLRTNRSATRSSICSVISIS
jgi:hypothetical protein